MPTDRLKIELEIEVGSTRVAVPGGNVERVELELQPFGFSGRVEFLVSEEKREDALLAAFLSQDPAQVRLTIGGVLDQPDPAPEPLAITGLGVERRLRESSFAGVRGEPVLRRHYSVSFADHASVLWRQHFPTVLDAEASLSDLIKRQVVQGISLEISLEALKSERALICLPLGESEVSFYDFTCWIADRLGGSFHYDYGARQHCLASGKPSGGSVATLRGTELAEVTIHLPQVRRDSARVLNASTEATKTVTVGQTQAIDGLYSDHLICAPIASAVDDRKQLEQRRLQQRLPQLAVRFSRFPTIACVPGTLTKIGSEHFSQKRALSDRTFRCLQLSLAARRGAGAEAAEGRDPVVGLDAQEAVYELDVHARWERQDDPVCTLPRFAAPRFPVLAEGKIVCEMGQEGDRSYMIYSDEKTGQSFYKVRVPLWNKEIMVPFAPDFIPGHFYLPAFKDSRVMVALYFDRAEIVRFLDWGADVQLPADSQGNHLLFGKNSTSETSAKHHYVDSKPVLSILRTADGDTELLQLEDGTIIIETKEDPSAASASETFDLTPQVAAARAKLTMASKAAVAEVSGQLESASGELNGELEGALNQTRAGLDGVEGAITGKVQQVTSEVETALAGLADKAGPLKGAAAEAKAALKKELDL